ncbi:MAG: hypothetical protein FWD58_05810 [Firmicutes bacterium]|nr:hypothetical protein [Bacillota bacterium]
MNHERGCRPPLSVDACAGGAFSAACAVGCLLREKSVCRRADSALLEFCQADCRF